MKKKYTYLFVFLIFTQCTKSNDTNKPNNEKYQEEIIFKENKLFKIIKGPCGSISYVDKIGENYEMALDSLLKFALLPNAGCPNLPCSSYYMEKDTITVDFNYDNRQFFSIIFKDSTNNTQSLSANNVIDSKGNYYKIKWCND